MHKILWIDDEIEMLRSHILFLTEKGYEVDTATNGEDGISKVKENNYDLIFLDEMMPGLGGLETLSILKEFKRAIPIVMVTKSEEESLMNDAIGSKINDYLIKPIVPSQILMVCKKVLQSKKISEEYVTKDYLTAFNEITQRLMGRLEQNDWIDIYTKLVDWELELDAHPEINLRQLLDEQKKECNKEFCKYVERNYKYWINNPEAEDIPLFSTDIMENYVTPHLKKNQGPTFFFVLDCLRLDQWKVLEKHLQEFFHISTEHYYSILPTATAYSRNALFSGLFPTEINKYFPDFWKNGDDEKGLNNYEKDLLSNQLERLNVKLKNDLKYLKIIDPDVGRSFEGNVTSHKKTHFMAVVVNFLDMVAHGRSDSDLLKEIAPDESAYRSLTNSWFIHSSLFSTLKKIASIPNAKIVLTTDHGSVRSLRATKVLGDKEASNNLRFKFGRNLKADAKHAIKIEKPAEYKLPSKGMTVNYIFAKEDYYFIYPTDYHKFQNQYKDTFLHGGISLEEMILPVVTLESKV